MYLDNCEFRHSDLTIRVWSIPHRLFLAIASANRVVPAGIISGFQNARMIGGSC